MSYPMRLLVAPLSVKCGIQQSYHENYWKYVEKTSNRKSLRHFSKRKHLMHMNRLKIMGKVQLLADVVSGIAPARPKENDNQFKYFTIINNVLSVLFLKIPEIVHSLYCSATKSTPQYGQESDTCKLNYSVRFRTFMHMKCQNLLN